MYSFKILLDYVKENKWLIIAYIIFTLFTMPFQTIIIPKIYSGFFKKLNEKKIDPSIFLTYLGYLFFSLLLVNICYYIIYNLNAQIVPKMYEHIMVLVYHRLLLLYENNYTDIELGKLFTHVNNAPYNLTKVFKSFIYLFPQLATVFVMNIYFFIVDIKLGLVSVFILILYMFLQDYTFRKCSTTSTEKEKSLETVNQSMQDKISNLYSIYSFGNINNEVKNYEKIVKDFKEKYTETSVCTNKADIMGQGLNFVNFVALASITTYLYMTKKITKEVLISILMMIMYYTPVVMGACNGITDLSVTIGFLNGMEDFFEKIYTVDQVQQREKTQKIKQGNILFHNLSFEYNSAENNHDHESESHHSHRNNKIFENFYLDIPPGQKCGIVGTSGSGKSTLIKLLLGYYKVPRGMIFIDEVDINDYQLSELRKQITFINQNTKLFDTTIFENIQYGNTMSKEEITQKCKELKLDGLFSQLKNGFETKVGLNGDKLSGGQRQAVHILRNISKQNKIIILDEPTSAIDDEYKEYIVNALIQLGKNSTVILITHDKNILHMCDRTIYMNSGKIINQSYN